MSSPSAAARLEAAADLDTPPTPLSPSPADEDTAAGHPHLTRLRTLAFVGPAGAGKTTLAEALLDAAGATGTPGSVERGSTVSDHDAQERQIQHSLQPSLMHLMHDGTEVHFIDAPGLPDLVGRALPTLEAVDTAVIVINATAGIEPMAVQMMAQAASRRLDRMIVVNRIDAAGVDLPGLLVQLQQTFGRECLPLNLPADGASRVVDCFYRRTGASDFSSVEAAHQALVEQVVEVDAGFVERYLNDGDIDPTELHAPLEQALREGHLIPVCFTSARSGAGLRELLDVISRLLPHPGEGNPPDFLRGDGAKRRTEHAVPDADRHVLAHVWRVEHDPYLGRIGYLRVHQGTVRRDAMLCIGDARKPFKVAHLLQVQGAQRTEIPRALPGELCALAKVDGLHFDAVLHDAGHDEHLHLAPLVFPEPVHAVALQPRRHGDEQKLWDAVQKLVDEDPCLRVEQAAETGETLLRGLGEMHLKLTLERLEAVHHVQVDAAVPRIAYRETITRAGQAQYRHKKQSGGAGQFGEVHLRVTPLPRGQGYAFRDEVRGGAIPSQFMPAVEKGVQEALAGGVLAGYPVVDVQVTVHDGKHHSVDSKEIAFIAAARKATQLALLEAQPQLLEPIVVAEIIVPEAQVGDITGDLASRRGQVIGTDVRPGRLHAVRALVPLAELATYAARLSALTGGQGRYGVQPSHLEPAPGTLQREMAAQFRHPAD